MYPWCIHRCASKSSVHDESERNRIVDGTELEKEEEEERKREGVHDRVKKRIDFQAKKISREWMKVTDWPSSELRKKDSFLWKEKERKRGRQRWGKDVLSTFSSSMIQNLPIHFMILFYLLTPRKHQSIPFLFTLLSFLYRCIPLPQFLSSSLSQFLFSPLSHSRATFFTQEMKPLWKHVLLWTGSVRSKYLEEMMTVSVFSLRKERKCCFPFIPKIVIEFNHVEKWYKLRIEEKVKPWREREGKGGS